MILPSTVTGRTPTIQLILLRTTTSYWNVFQSFVTSCHIREICLPSYKGLLSHKTIFVMFNLD